MSVAGAYVAQVGGDHYNHPGDQHWDLMARYEIDGLLWNATKYIERYRKKGKPLEDLGKAKSYVEKRIALGWAGHRRGVPIDALRQYCDEHRFTAIEARLFTLLLSPGATVNDLYQAVGKIELLIQELPA